MFYLQTLKDIPVDDPRRQNEGYFFIAIKNKALELLWSRQRFVHYSYEMENDVAINSQCFENEQSVENKDMVEAMFKGLSDREQRVLLMIMGDANITQIARELKMSCSTIYKLLDNLKKNFKF